MKRGLPLVAVVGLGIIAPGCATVPGSSTPVKMTITPTGDVATPGLPLELVVSVKNTSSSALWICKWPGVAWDSLCDEAGLGTAGGGRGRGGIYAALYRLEDGRVACRSEKVDYSDEDFVLLGPGERYPEKLTFNVPLEYSGKMQLTCTFTSQFDGATVGKHAWTGSLAETITLPVSRAPIASADQAIHLLTDTVKRDKLYENWRSMECLMFLADAEGDKGYDLEVREQHDPPCDGDPNVASILDRFRVTRDGRIFWLDIAEDEYHPYEQVRDSIRRQGQH